MSEHSSEKSTDRPEVEGDVESDPSLDDTTGGEWADEGGAMPEGPATDEDNSE